jgi:hypothetical protein
MEFYIFQSDITIYKLYDQNRAKQINTIGDKTVPKRHKKSLRFL